MQRFAINYLPQLRSNTVSEFDPAVIIVDERHSTRARSCVVSVQVGRLRKASHFAALVSDFGRHPKMVASVFQSILMCWY